MIYKINASEAARLFGKNVRRNEDVPAEDLRQYAAELFRRFQKPVFITRSSLGILVFDGKEHTELPALKIDEPIDTVGAGDTAVAAIACSLAAGATLKEAGMLANLAAAVAIKKLKQTGTASANEILDLVAKMP
jgi:sugar/nucleoside kinase (ribokinase family)